MNYSPPEAIELTDAEANLWAQIPDHPSHDSWYEIADAMEALTESLLARKVIPEVRLRLFCDPKYAEKGSKSRKQVFESNDTSGNDIFRNPHFIPYLRHFISGPQG